MKNTDSLTVDAINFELIKVDSHTRAKHGIKTKIRISAAVTIKTDILCIVLILKESLIAFFIAEKSLVFCRSISIWDVMEQQISGKKRKIIMGTATSTSKIIEPDFPIGK